MNNHHIVELDGLKTIQQKTITIILEETTLDEMIEDLSLTEIEQNLVQIILITKIFKEKHQEETIITHQN